MTETLLQETIEILEGENKTKKDVLWIGTDHGCISWSEFEELADREYDSGFGGTEVNDNLKVVGENWWIERHEYDGSEWWEYKEHPKKPKEAKFTQTFQGEYEFLDEEKLFIFKE